MVRPASAPETAAAARSPPATAEVSVRAAPPRGRQQQAPTVLALPASGFGRAGGERGSAGSVPPGALRRCGCRLRSGGASSSAPHKRADDASASPAPATASRRLSRRRLRGRERARPASRAFDAGARRRPRRARFEAVAAAAGLAAAVAARRRHTAVIHSRRRPPPGAEGGGGGGGASSGASSKVGRRRGRCASSSRRPRAPASRATLGELHLSSTARGLAHVERAGRRRRRRRRGVGRRRLW